MVDKNQLHLAIRTLATLAGFSLATGTLAMEVRVYSISDFVPVAAGGCGGGDLHDDPAMVGAWYDEMFAQGHSRDGQHTNGIMTVRRFCDPSWGPFCYDHAHFDDADAALVSTHGLDSFDHWAGTMRYRSRGQCVLDAGGLAHDMHVGDQDLEFIHVASCYSADDDNLSGIRYAMHDPVDGGFAHLWTGFHGQSYSTLDLSNDYKDFADDAHSVPLASAWVTNHFLSNSMGCAWYDPFNHHGTCTHDQCPVAYAIGPSRSQALLRLNYTRYNAVGTEPTGYSAYAYLGVDGCDPAGETAFNP
jgi:hypothetical protein